MTYNSAAEANIATEYDNQTTANEQTKTSISNQMSLVEEQGEQVTTGYYKDLISAETTNQNLLITKHDALQKFARFTSFILS